MKKLFALFISALLLFSFTSLSIAENDINSWVCPVCGSINNENFCPKDGTPRIDYEDVDNVTSSIELPVLSDSCDEFPIKLHALANDTERAYSHAGPGKNYMGSGGYKPYKQKDIIGYYLENDWVFCSVQYATAEKRFVYLPKYSFESLDIDMPYFESLVSFDGETIGDTISSWGPSYEYNLLTSRPIESGTPIKAFFQENGYVFAEFKSKGELMRMWLPADKVSIPNVTVAITNDPHIQTGRSGWGYENNDNKDEIETVENNDSGESIVTNTDAPKQDVTTVNNNSDSGQETIAPPNEASSESNTTKKESETEKSNNTDDDDDDDWSEWR